MVFIDCDSPGLWYSLSVRISFVLSFENNHDAAVTTLGQVTLKAFGGQIELVIIWFCFTFVSLQVHLCAFSCLSTVPWTLVKPVSITNMFHPSDSRRKYRPTFKPTQHVWEMTGRTAMWKGGAHRDFAREGEMILREMSAVIFKLYWLAMEIV